MSGHGSAQTGRLLPSSTTVGGIVDYQRRLCIPVVWTLASRGILDNCIGNCSKLDVSGQCEHTSAYIHASLSIIIEPDICTCFNVDGTQSEVPSISLRDKQALPLFTEPPLKDPSMRPADPAPLPTSTAMPVTLPTAQPSSSAASAAGRIAHGPIAVLVYSLVRPGEASFIPSHRMLGLFTDLIAAHPGL